MSSCIAYIVQLLFCHEVAHFPLLNKQISFIGQSVLRDRRTYTHVGKVASDNMNRGYDSPCSFDCHSETGRQGMRGKELFKSKCDTYLLEDISERMSDMLGGSVVQKYPALTCLFFISCPH
jgi:hypothetical protein